MPAGSPSPRRRRFSRARLGGLGAALTLSLAGTLAGCGSSSPAGTTADPAGVVPSSAALYAGATVRPTGAQARAALATGRALTHEADPYLRLLASLQTPGAPQLSYAKEVAPWLGPRAGIFLTSLKGASSTLLSLVRQGLLGDTASSAFPFGADGAQGAIVLDTSNLAKARGFVQDLARHAGAHSASYKGVGYESSSAGVAFGVVRRFAVIGSEAGMRAVIETADGVSSLEHASGYAKLLAAAPPSALAHVYAGPASSSAQPAGAHAPSGLLALLAGSREANLSVVPASGSSASAGSLTIDADTLASTSSATSGGFLAADPEGATALSELPGGSWLAIGLGHLGRTVGQDVQGLQSLTSLASTLGGAGPESTAGISIGGLLQGLLAPLGVLGADTPAAKRDFASWMGSGGMFASGASLLELRGAVVISSKDPARSRAAVAELSAGLRKAGGIVTPVRIAGTEAAAAARLSGLPVVLDIAAGRNAAGRAKFVIGIGEASVQEALDPPSTMAHGAPSEAARNALGEGAQPSMILELPTLLSLLEGVGLTEAPSISQFIPYLRAVTTLAGGGHSLGSEVERFKLVLSLQ
ncbi:MAG: DUF3352 domain-containing protein [Solirubrobacteraceae bacterium]